MNKGKICVSVCAETADELIEQIRCAEDLADIIEIRFDCLNQLQFKKFLTDFRNLEQNFLVTFRPEQQGGKRELSLSERRKFWEYISSSTNDNYFDIEPDLQKKFARLRINRRIASFHQFYVSKTNLENTFDELADTNSEIVKIAVQADDITDSIAVWKLLEKAKGENRQIIPIAMGEAGKWTRILGLAHGALMTFAALESGKETAPGQVSAQDLSEVYRVKELDEQTEVYGILGGNTSVSMSPYMHNAAFRFHNLNAVFVPLQISDLEAFIRRMVKPETREIELNFRGFSVTIPHKQTIIKYLDSLDETAERIGAVNTVKIENGTLRGYNTDAQGFIEPLLNTYGNLSGAKIAVIGAGGAARACIYALQKEGAKVTVFARDLQKAKNIAEDFQVELQPLGTRHSALGTYENFDILVNTTPLGMKGKAEGETPVVAEQMKGLHLIYDLVYTPFQTRLMAEADRAEVPKIGGLAMLVAQATAQQKIWTGKDAPLKEMSRAVLKRLQ